MIQEPLNKPAVESVIWSRDMIKNSWKFHEFYWRKCSAYLQNSYLGMSTKLASFCPSHGTPKTGYSNQIWLLIWLKTSRRLRLLATTNSSTTTTNLLKSSSRLTEAKSIWHHCPIQTWQGHVFGATRHQILQNPSGTLCTEALCIQWLNRWHLTDGQNVGNTHWDDGYLVALCIAGLHTYQLAQDLSINCTHLFSVAGFGFKIMYASWQTSRVHMSWTIDLISYSAS